MNLWRWLGVSLFMVGAFFLVGATKFPVYAGGKDKDKDAKTEKDKDAKAEKDKDAKDKDAKDKDKGKDKDAKDKDKGKDEKKVVAPPTTGGDKWSFNAFNPDAKPIYQEQKTKTEQTMTVQGQKVVQNQSQTFMIQWTPQAKDKDGNFVVKQKIVGVKMEIDIGGNKIKYDSTEKNPKNPMTDFFEALVKEELVFTITPDLTVKGIEGREKFIKNLIDINPQMQGLLKAILSEAALKKMAEPTWWAYPAGGTVTKDQTWKKDATLDLGPIGTYTTDFVFTYKGQDAGKDKIGIKTTLKYAAPTEKGGLPFSIQKAELKGDGGDGEAIFDRAKGRFESTKMTMKLNGQITIDVGNMTTTVDLNQTQESTSKTHDVDEWQKK